MNPLNLIHRSREFRKRLEESRPRLYRVAYSWSHDGALADDLVQETLAKALKNAGQLRDYEAMNTWLFGILTNCWRDHHRRIRETEDIDNHELFHEQTPEAEHAARDIRSRVRAAVALLPEGQREVLTLVALEGFSYSEVADMLSVPIGTVMSRLCRGRRALAGLLCEVRATEETVVVPIRRVK